MLMILSFLVPAANKNLTCLMRILSCFEMISGLRVNLTNIRLFEAEILKTELEEMATTLGFTAVSLPFLYLGLPIRTEMNQSVSWDLAVAKFKNVLLSS